MQRSPSYESTRRKTSAVNPDDPCERIETRVSYEGDTPSKTLKVYRAFPWGQELVKEVEDADGEALTTEYTYFEDRNDPRYSWQKPIKYPDGTVRHLNKR